MPAISAIEMVFLNIGDHRTQTLQIFLPLSFCRGKLQLIVMIQQFKQQRIKSKHHAVRLDIQEDLHISQYFPELFQLCLLDSIGGSDMHDKLNILEFRDIFLHKGIRNLNQQRFIALTAAGGVEFSGIDQNNIVFFMYVFFSC